MKALDTYDPLRTSLATGNAVAFVGAGMSAGAGLPGWYQLVSELSQRIGYRLPPAQFANSDTLIDAAQYYVNKEGLHSLISFLKVRLDTTGRNPSTAHKAMARLPFSTVFTANYDDLLERAYREAGKSVRVIVGDRSLPFQRRDPGIVNLVKLYGDLNQPETIVLVKQQYEAFFLQRPQTIKLLETELARSDFVYLGWSHSDPHFNLVFGEMLARFGQLMHTGYAVMFNVPEALRLDLERKHIRLVECPSEGDPTAQTTDWLNQLSVS